ncbi:MAG: AP2/ERF family transcription factor, partial [Sarcina sp.]
MQTLNIDKSTIEKNKELFRSIVLDKNKGMVKLRTSRAFNRKYLQYILVSIEYNISVENIKTVEFIDGDSFNFCITNLRYRLFDEQVEKLYIPRSVIATKNIVHIMTRDRVNGYNIVYYDLDDYMIVEFINPKTKKIIQTKIDSEMFDVIKNFRLTPKLNNSGHYYIDISLENGKHDKLHRFISKPEDGMQVDHIDRDTLNNRNANLRNVTPQVNCQNRGIFKNNSSGVVGVSYNKNNHSWEACLIFNGVKKSKSFNIDIFGNTIAFKKACEYRKELENIYEINSDI